MLRYSLSKNPISTDKSCIAVVSGFGTKTIDDIIDAMVAEGTGLTRPQALAYYEKLEQTIEFFVRSGFTVSTPLLRIRSSISGTFTDYRDKYDPARHRINIKAVSGSRLRKIGKEMDAKKVAPSHPEPEINLFSDITSEQINHTVTSGGIGILKGHHLKFDPGNSELGVFFRDQRKK
jgi:hypothetical protein